MVPNGHEGPGVEQGKAVVRENGEGPTSQTAVLSTVKRGKDTGVVVKGGVMVQVPVVRQGAAPTMPP